MIVCVHISVMRAGVVFNGILYKLETRDTYSIKRKVICSSRIVYGYSSSAHVIEWLQPACKQRAHSFVTLQVNTTNFAGTIIQVVISRNLCLLRLQLHCSWVA